MASEGANVEAIIDRLQAMKQNINAYFMVDDLTNLQKGGRLSSAQAIIGGLLKVKPILHMVDGLIVPFEKIRTRKRAITRIMEMLARDAEAYDLTKVVFIHGNKEQATMNLESQYKEQQPEVETLISYFGPVIGTHLGENSVGVAWYY